VSAFFPASYILPDTSLSIEGCYKYTFNAFLAPSGICPSPNPYNPFINGGTLYILVGDCSLLSKAISNKFDELRPSY